MTELWLRNPLLYIKEVAEVGHRKVIWDRGILIKRSVDPYKHAKLYFGETADFRSLSVGNQGTLEVDQDHDFTHPKAVYPTWEYGESMQILEEMMAENVGNDPAICEDLSIPLDQRPVLGQEHRVIVAAIPPANQAWSRQFYLEIKELQEEYPECILHLHGSYSFRIMFGLGYRAADYEPRTHAANKTIMLPNGKLVKTDQALQNNSQWIHALNYKIIEVRTVPRKRCMYNIAAAIWASKHWDQNLKFKTQGLMKIDPDSPESKPPAGKTIYRGEPGPGDMITCNTCSLAKTCKYYREGAVCSVPGSESSILARYFQSRDSNSIIDALGAVIGTQVKRTERAMEAESQYGEMDPQVSKDLNAIFSNGVKLAKLVDPKLAVPKLAINMTGGQVVANASPNQIMSEVVRQLEAQGIKRADITPEMVQGVLTKAVPKEVEGQVVEKE